MNPETEICYEAGSRNAWACMLNICLRQLGYKKGHPVACIAEREGAIIALRRLCAEHGDNDWDENLYLADIIEKHLERYLEA